jgi:hypothetical protein
LAGKDGARQQAAERLTMASLGDWTLRVAGEVVAIEREDLDKSGRHPKYMLTFRIEPSEIEAPEGAVLPAVIPARIKDLELDRLVKVRPAVGDRIVVTARASGARPATFYITAVAAA